QQLLFSIVLNDPCGEAIREPHDFGRVGNRSQSRIAKYFVDRKFLRLVRKAMRDRLARFATGQKKARSTGAGLLPVNELERNAWFPWCVIGEPTPVQRSTWPVR